jgi:hypothetical protein
MTGQYRNIDTIPTVGSSLVYEDMGTTTGGIARNTDLTTGDGWTTIYEYTGCGVFIGFLTTFEDENRWEVELSIDGNTIFSILAGDLNDEDLYGYFFQDGPDMEPGRLGVHLSRHTFYFNAPQKSAIPYLTNVRVRVRKISGGARRWRAGLAILTKEG